uniref:Saposin B-type domain-containing protein n=1 Tax=Panagrolaimus sp. PS1159 TaxID=55785 RepID=A0AC35GJJ5_9BILA
MVQTIAVFASFAILAISAVAHVLPFNHLNADAKRTQDPCRICTDIIQRAENFFANQSITPSQLRRQLERECIQLSSTDGNEASAACIKMVQNNFEFIYYEVISQIPSKQICQDISQCPETTDTTPSWHVTTTVNPGLNFSTTPFSGNSTNQGWTTTTASGNSTQQQWNISTTAFPPTNQGWNFTIGSNMTATPSQQQWNVTSLPTATTTLSPTGNSTLSSTGNNTVANLLERLQSAKNVFVFTLN